MGKSNRQNAPRDRAKPIKFPKPPCSPKPPGPPPPVKPSDPGCGTGPDPLKILKGLGKKKR